MCTMREKSNKAYRWIIYLFLCVCFCVVVVVVVLGVCVRASVANNARFGVCVLSA